MPKRAPMPMRATMPSTPEMSRPKLRRISGVSTLKAVRSSSSTALSPNSTTRGNNGAPSVIPALSRPQSRSRFGGHPRAPGRFG